MIRTIQARARRRRGISMIEMMVMMTCIATMFGICGLMYKLLFDLELKSNERAQGATNLARLAEEFRRDAHEARDAGMITEPARPEPVGIRFNFAGPDRFVEYRSSSPGVITRTETSNGKPGRRESYPIFQAASIAFSTEVEDVIMFATIAVNRASVRELPGRPRLFRILAQVGKDAQVRKETRP